MYTWQPHEDSPKACCRYARSPLLTQATATLVDMARHRHLSIGQTSAYVSQAIRRRVMTMLSPLLGRHRRCSTATDRPKLTTTTCTSIPAISSRRIFWKHWQPAMTQRRVAWLQTHCSTPYISMIDGGNASRKVVQRNCNDTKMSSHKASFLINFSSKSWIQAMQTLARKSWHKRLLTSSSKLKRA